MAELQAKLEELERERDALDHECNELHSKHGDALNEIELLKEQIANQKSEPATPLMKTAAPAQELPDRWTFKSRLITKLPLFKTVKKGKKEVYEPIEDKDAQIILDVLEELL